MFDAARTGHNPESRFQQSMSPTGKSSPQLHGVDLRARRRTRKGTRSCWECKRRKMRCTFGSDIHSNTCTNCHRRGSQCLSQEFPEEMGVEAVPVARLRGGLKNAGTGQKTSNANTPALDVPPTPLSMSSEPVRQPEWHRFENLSGELHAKLPSREDAARIMHLVPQPPASAHEMMTMPYTWPFREKSPETSRLLETPDSKAHPVLIARYMLSLAGMLVHLDREAYSGIEHLSSSPKVMSARLVDLATSQVTTKDEMLGSIESVDCIMMESVYHANLGNLRRSWVAARRAVSVGQLMGLNRLDNRAQVEILNPKEAHNPSLVWSRIVFLDRFLCLMLGLPQGCTDLNMSSEALLTTTLPLERLERVHCAVASRVLERNDIETKAYDHNITRALDEELQKAARNVPSKWWLVPKLSSTRTDPQAIFGETGRIFAQVLHYNLLNQLHLPYMLRSRASERTNDYSRITCVTASREILTRFIALRSFNDVASSCRIIDFVALMAAMTLLLAHLDHAPQTEDPLAHQYHSDRAMLEQVQESFLETNSTSLDALSASSADLLRQLLAVEADGSCGFANRRVSVHKADTDLAEADGDHEGAVSVHVPYFGIVRIASGPVEPELEVTERTHAEPVSFSGPSDPTNITTSHRKCDVSRLDSGNNRTGYNDLNAGTNSTEETQAATPRLMADMYSTSGTRPHEQLVADFDPSFSNIQLNPPAADIFPETLSQIEQYPGLVAGIDDWAFQGTDLAFFDSLMRSHTDGSDAVTDWTTMGDCSTSNVPY